MNSRTPNRDAKQLLYRASLDGYFTNISTKFTESFIRTQTLPEIISKDNIKKPSSSCPTNPSDLQVCQRNLPDYHSNIFLIYNLHLHITSFGFDYQMPAYLFQKALNSFFFKSNLILYPFFCFISFFCLYSNVR